MLGLQFRKFGRVRLVAVFSASIKFGYTRIQLFDLEESLTIGSSENEDMGNPNGGAGARHYTSGLIIASRDVGEW